MGTAALAQTEAVVTALAETDATTGDTDDPAIWVAPADGAASRIIGTDKTFGLRVYDLNGKTLLKWSREQMARAAATK